MEEQYKGGFKESLLNKRELEDFKHAQKRIEQLKDNRKDHYGVDLDDLWAEADRDYAPHRLNSTGKRYVVTDEDKGWRGALVRLGSSDWQSDIAQSNPFVKIQTALSILVDQNPSGVFTPVLKKFQATTELIHQLYKRSWEVARSKSQLKLFIFNLTKYGWAIGRTFPLKLVRTVKVLKVLNPDDPSKNEYEEKKVVDYDDVMRENLDPRNTWIDDMTRPNDYDSMNDWCYRKVYTMEQAKKEFGKYKFWKYVKPGGTLDETLTDNAKKSDKDTVRDDLVEAYFYENLARDLFYVEFNGVPLVIEPLPVSNYNGSKKLSCWHTYWNIRHAESPYGIGVYEAIRYQNSMLDRITNMTIDQLTLSIYKMFFYQGTDKLTETGDFRISPGVGKQVLDPKSINWLETPGPGRDAWEGLQYFQDKIDEYSGIGDPLLGAVTGKTAFEIAQAKEAALKRLKDPLNNILEALNTEAYITISLMQLMYSIPETHVISDPDLMQRYLEEVQADPELYERNENDEFVAKIYRQFPLNLDEDENKNLIETDETKFFRIKPKYLNWEGIVNIKSQSILSPSKQIDKAMDIEMYNLLTPWVSIPNGQQLFGKMAKSLIKHYDKDPKEILPDSWINEQPQQPQQLPQPQGQPQGQQGGGLFTKANTNIGTQTGQNPQAGGGLFQKIGQMASKLNPFRNQ
ncbi:hypothetical protein M0R04_10905 [Candidatus Dojkabacteria bacterium]|nr:hypothetical protein [Candidatus Dojkabacteria bacterium]